MWISITRIFIAVYRIDDRLWEGKSEICSNREEEESSPRPECGIEREKPRAPLRPMNHAYATRACSIINARLIRRSSSTLKIFTKVRTTANFTERNRKAGGNLSTSGKEEWSPYDSPFILIVAKPSAPSLRSFSTATPKCTAQINTDLDQEQLFFDIFQAVNLFVLLTKENEVMLCASFGSMYLMTTLRKA